VLFVKRKGCYRVQEALFRQAVAHDVATMIDWAAREGWNPGLDDIGPFWAADPGGYWLAQIDGRPAACISLVHHQADRAFLGFYIAAPEYRGKGIGHQLWRSALQRSRAKSIGLDGVAAQQDNYRKSGFVYAHANMRYGGHLPAGEPDPEIGPVGDALAAVAIAYDARLNAMSRPRFAAAWFADTPTRKSGCILRDGAIVALGTVRACREGNKIGPLFAETEAVADRLFRHLVAKAGGGRIFLDVAVPNAAAHALCKRYGMTPIFETARMYRGEAPEPALANIFGITTFELG
jgi:RimJ/RimL family protein N-acetyltransferase